MVSDTDESALNLNEILKVELKNANVQSSSTRWDQTTVAMKKQPDDDCCFVFFFLRIVSVRSKRHCCLFAFKILRERVNTEGTSD